MIRNRNDLKKETLKPALPLFVNTHTHTRARTHRLLQYPSMGTITPPFCHRFAVDLNPSVNLGAAAVLPSLSFYWGHHRGSSVGKT